MGQRGESYRSDGGSIEGWWWQARGRKVARGGPGGPMAGGRGERRGVATAQQRLLEGRHRRSGRRVWCRSEDATVAHVYSDEGARLQRRTGRWVSGRAAVWEGARQRQCRAGGEWWVVGGGR